MQPITLTETEKKAQAKAVKLFEAFRATMPDIDVNAKEKTKRMVVICCNEIIEVVSISEKEFYREVIKQLGKL